MSNPMDGFAQLPLDVSKLLPFMEACIAHKVTYGLGAKDPTPNSSLPIDYSKIDCSGFAREAIKAMGGALIPDGSWNEDAWFRAYKDAKGQHLKVSDFASTSLHDGRLRVCVAIASKSEPIGHIWFALNGVTYESYGGHGPGMRAWNTPVLARIVTHVLVLRDAPASAEKPHYKAKATSYYPDASALEGGFNDRMGHPLCTLQGFLAGKASYVSVAMDTTAFPYGQILSIPELDAHYGERIVFKVVDTGGAFKGKGTTRIDICSDSEPHSLDPALNGMVTLIPA